MLSETYFRSSARGATKMFSGVPNWRRSMRKDCGPNPEMRLSPIHGAASSGVEQPKCSNDQGVTTMSEVLIGRSDCMMTP